MRSQPSCAAPAGTPSYTPAVTPADVGAGEDRRRALAAPNRQAALRLVGGPAIGESGGAGATPATLAELARLAR